jgi:hypothetical protein
LDRRKLGISRPLWSRPDTIEMASPSAMAVFP